MWRERGSHGPCLRAEVGGRAYHLGHGTWWDPGGRRATPHISARMEGRGPAQAGLVPPVSRLRPSLKQQMGRQQRAAYLMGAPHGPLPRKRLITRAPAPGSANLLTLS